MMRLILLILFVAALLTAFTAMVTAMQAMGSVTRQATEGDSMPDTIKRVAYALLFVLLVGLSTGWLGAA